LTLPALRAIIQQLDMESAEWIFVCSPRNWLSGKALNWRPRKLQVLSPDNDFGHLCSYGSARNSVHVRNSELWEKSDTRKDLPVTQNRRAKQ
jgi:hypothetical protein